MRLRKNQRLLTNTANVLRSTAYVLTLLAVFGVSGRADQTNGIGSSVSNDSLQIRYFSNLDPNGSFINLTNDGTLGSGGPGLLGLPNALCANIYAFAPDEQLIACCSCLVTPDGLSSMSVQQGILNNTLTGAALSSVVVKVITSVPTFGVCNPAAITAGELSPGIEGWGTTLHTVSTSPVTYQMTETPFAFATLSASELIGDVTECSFINVLGSGAGICGGCQAGGLGAAKE